jgi:putative transposase
MPRYLRNYQPGGTFFFTAVSHERRATWTSNRARDKLREAIEHVQRRFPFEIIAIALLPEHIHTIWKLPAGDTDYSTRWRRVKEEFTRRFLRSGGSDGAINSSRRRHRERAVWQRRFWEHTVRDEADLERLLNYLHWNPVKHGLVARVIDYPWSSFHRYVEMGVYPANWGLVDPCPDYDDPEWE